MCVLELTTQISPSQKCGLCSAASGTCISGNTATPLSREAMDVCDSGYICIFSLNILWPFEENARIIVWRTYTMCAT